jgi:hypothetical protein
VPAATRDRRDGLAHVPGSDDGDVRHGVLLCEMSLVVATSNSLQKKTCSFK